LDGCGLQLLSRKRNYFGLSLGEGWQIEGPQGLRDLIGVGQTDQIWPGWFPPALAARLREILDNPDG
jgi:hypothetical protein